MTTTSKDFYEADEVEGVLGRLLTVQVEKRQVYGVDKYYPIKGNLMSSLVVALTGTKTLTSQNINVLKDFGYEVKAISNTEIL